MISVLGGSAKELVKTQYPNDLSYTNSLQTLDRLFYNPANLLREMIRNLMKTNRMSDTYESQLSGMAKMRDAWNDLDQAKLNYEELKGLFFIAATEKNLSESQWQCWLDEQNAPKHRENMLGVFEIGTYMRAIETAVTNAQKRQNISGNRTIEPKFKNNYNKTSTLYGSYNLTHKNNKQTKGTYKAQDQARTKEGKCVMCKQQPHKYQLYCPQLKDMDPQEIKRIMNKENIKCNMCLGTKHNTRECRDTNEGRLKVCHKKNDNDKECGGYHCGYLHFRQYKPTPASNLTVNETKDNNHSEPAVEEVKN